MRADEIWALLPAALRSEDEAAGGVLRALVEVMAEQAALVAADIDQLTDDWFVETCAEWVVPYLGELVGAARLHPLGDATAFSDRARVADTIRFRRRKGTAAALEELTRANTGWSTAAVEFFERLVITQHVNHVKTAPATAAIRDAEPLELVGGPFERVCRTVDVRSMDAGRARPNIPHIGMYVWPLPSYRLDRATAAPVADPPDGRWRIDPVGVDRQLTGPTVTEPDIDHRADEANVPGPLRRRPLRDELAALASAAPPAPDERRWFREDDPSFVVWIQPTAGDELRPVPLEQLRICDLAGWEQPTGSLVRVDPVRGRVTLAPARPAHRLAVSWWYAFSADVGAGPYPRRGDLGAADGPVDWQLGVSATEPPRAGEVVASIGEAVTAWHDWQAAHPGTAGRIVLLDSHRYPENLTVQIGQGSRLTMLAAQWPRPPDGPRRQADLDPVGVRPCLLGGLSVTGRGAGDRPGELVVDGLLVSGPVAVTAPAAGGPGLGRVELRHCTVGPAATGLTVAAGNDRTAVTLHRCVAGSIATGDGPLSVTDTLVHGGITAPDAEVELAGATVLGSTTARVLTATDCLFDGVVTVARRQQGHVRFSWLRPGSVTPRRYRCQPDLAQQAHPGDPDVATRVGPAFASTHYGDASYGRLAETAAAELRTGAESGAEMGAFRRALTPQRLNNLALALQEYLPLGRVAAALPVLPTGGTTP
ncbi:phage tail protein [Micromonospora sp. CPCC 205711]|uniref:phage tail protein n=1 Tax=Micromonospora sp. CPCC 205547 TaxID=3122400 RepID=UPI002FF1E637